MIRGLPASILLHVGLVASSYIVLPIFDRPREDLVIVPIELVNISEVNNIAPVAPRPDIEPEPETEPEVQPEELIEDTELVPDEIAPEEDIPPPAAAEQERAEPEAPEDVIPEEADPEEEVEPEPEPEEPEDKPKPEEREPDALDDILNTENLFNRERQPAKAPPPPAPEPEEEPDAPPPPEARRGVGERTAATARIEAIVLSQMRECWGTVEDLPEPERLTVTVKVTLNLDGSLRDEVELVKPRRAPIGDRFMQVAIDRALRAVRTCQPYRLPVDDYEDWEEIVLNFRHDG